MKKFFFLSLIVILITSVCQATIRRIQYWGLPIAGVDYATGTAAVAASAVGDTILVFESTNENFTIDKRLVIIGPGYFNWSGVDANFNANLQNIHPNGNLVITFAPGSDGTIVTGCRFNSSTSGTTAINNIKIRNCFNELGYWYIGNTGSNLTYDNWEFSKCYITYPIQVSANKVTNLKLFNCLSDGGALYLNPTLGQTGIIENCSFTNGAASLNLNSNGFLIQNCIFYSGSPSNYSNSVFNNNVFTGTPSPAVTGSGNIFNATANNIYVGFPTLGTNSIDGRFALKVASPAIGAGIGGIDCGAYGGVNPYKLSLIPAIPAFYKLTSPGTAASANPYQITFSVRANN